MRNNRYYFFFEIREIFVREVFGIEDVSKLKTFIPLLTNSSEINKVFLYLVINLNLLKVVGNQCPSTMMATSLYNGKVGSETGVLTLLW